jgi:putative ABC transport system permease protein
VKSGERTILAPLSFEVDEGDFVTITGESGSGATRIEAVLPFLRESFKRAVIPTITTLGTMGLVSLPGMMTGQLLAGSFPVVVIKYQIAIMVAIVTAGALSLFLTLLLTTRYLFDERDNIRPELFLEV